MNLSRRSLILGAAASIITAPAIVRAASIMKVQTVYHSGGLVEPQYLYDGVIAHVDCDDMLDSIRYVIHTTHRVPRKLLYCTTPAAEARSRGYMLIAGDKVRLPGAYNPERCVSMPARRSGKSAMMQLEHAIHPDVAEIFREHQFYTNPRNNTTEEKT